MKFESIILKKASMAILLVFTLSACMQEDLIEEQSETVAFGMVGESSATLPGGPNSSNNTKVSDSQIVVRYKDPNITEPQKQAIRALQQEQYHFIITQVQTCNCDLKDLELWTIDTSNPAFLGIEDVLQNLRNNEDEGDMAGDHQFFFSVTSVEVPCKNNNEGIYSWLAPENEDDLNIAIIDTGLDYDFLPRPLLNDSGNNPTCTDEISGYDFVNGDNDPMDDHYHGTLVSQVIIQSLDARQVPFQLIPLKAFNNKGRGDYFNVACAIRYILERGDVDLVNMSFGWDEVEYANIMKKMMDEMSEQTLFVASAGNNGRNTDTDGDGHFPSSYESDNLLTVAGYSPATGPLSTVPHYDGNGRLLGIEVDPYSNFGQFSIDLAAPFVHNITMRQCGEEGTMEEVVTRVGGTSYSAPFVVARAGYLLYQNRNSVPGQLKTATVRTGFVAPGLANQLSQDIAISSNMNQAGPVSY